MASGVRALRLLSGEDVFGKVQDVAVFDTGNWKGVELTNLENAAVLQVRMDEKTKQPMVGFSPYSPFGELKDVKIATDKIVMAYKEEVWQQNKLGRLIYTHWECSHRVDGWKNLWV